MTHAKRERSKEEIPLHVSDFSFFITSLAVALYGGVLRLMEPLSEKISAETNSKFTLVYFEFQSTKHFVSRTKSRTIF